MNPERLDLGDGADLHAKAGGRSLVHQLVVVVESVAPRLGLDPSPARPELDRVQPGRRHAGLWATNRAAGRRAGL